MSHMKGRLKAHGCYATNELGRAVFDCRLIPMEDEEIKVNVRRLVACWNACDGAETSSLERGLAGHPQPILNLARRNQALLEDRDELLAALERLERVSGQAMTQDDPDRAAARAILAKYPKAES